MVPQQAAAAPPAPRDPRPEADLVALARHGNEPAIRELIRRCNRQLFRVARGILHDDAEAEDAVQAAYVAGFTGLDGFRGEAGIATWLTRIAMNEAYARLRRRARIVDIAEYRKDIEGNAADMTRPPPTTPESELGRAEIRAFLESAIDALPEPLRLTYILREVQEMSTRDVAALLDLNAVTVKTRVYRARRRLRDAFREGLDAEFSSVFPFDGARCAGMADRVIAALRRGGSV